MTEAPLPPREAERLAALYRYEILDTPPEKELDDLVHLAAYICNTPISLISLVDSDRQWFKSKVGLTATQTSRYIAFCSHAILGDDLLIVPDALADERFAANPLVIGDPHIRFYCGAPLVTPGGYRIGTLNVIDHVPRELSAEQREAIRVLSHQVMNHLQLDREHRELIQAINERQRVAQALQASETKFRVLSETTTSGMYVYSGERFIYVNPAAAAITGYGIDELTGMALWDLVHPDFHAPLKARMLAIQQGGDVPVRIEFQIIRKDGELRWLDFTSTAVEFEGRQARIGAAYDITRRKKAEALSHIQRTFLEQVLVKRPMAETMDELVRSIEALSDGGVCSILLAHPDRGTLHSDAVSTLPESYNRAVDGLPIGPANGSCGTAAYRKEVVVVENIATDPLWAAWPGVIDLLLRHGWRACTSMPILDGQGEVLGTYAMYFKEARRPTAFELEMLRAASQTLRVAIERAQSDEALQTSEARFRAILDNSPLLIFIKDLEGRYLLTNRIFDRQFGLTDGQAVGHSDDELFSAVQAADFRQNDHEVWRTGKAKIFEEAAQYADGRHTGLVVKFPLLDASGKVSALCGLVTDITARKQAEEALRKREAQLRLSLEASHAGSWSWDVAKQLSQWDERYHELYGFEPHEPVSYEAWIARVHPDDRPRLETRIQELLKPGTDDVWHEDFRARHPVKGERWMEGLGRVERDADGRAVRLVGINLDITGRKHGEETLRRNEERFRLVAEATNDILWDWDLITDEHWWSPNAREKFGYDPNAEPSIAAWTDRLHADDRDRVMALVDRALASDVRAVTAEYRFRLADGSHGHFYDRGQIVRDSSGRPLRMTGAMIDVTLSKRAYAALEEAYRRLQRMSRELQSVESNERRRLSRELHDEVGQLLTALKFDLEAIRQALNEKNAVAGARARERTIRALDTTDELFARLGQVVRALRPPVLEELGLKAALEAMVADVQSRSDLVCSVFVGGEDAETLADPVIEAALYRMAQELVTNVVRHAQAKTLSVMLTRDSRQWTLTIQDDGIGFNPQAESINGMGIRGVRERAEILGGRVDVSSVSGAGTAITVWIPVSAMNVFGEDLSGM